MQSLPSKYSLKTGRTASNTKKLELSLQTKKTFFKVHRVIANARKCKAGGYLHTPSNFKWTNVQPWSLCPSYVHALQSTCLVLTCLWSDMQLQKTSTQMQTMYHSNFCADLCANSSNSTKTQKDHGQGHSYSLSTIWNCPLTALTATRQGKITKAHYHHILQHLQVTSIHCVKYDEDWESKFM